MPYADAVQRDEFEGFLFLDSGRIFHIVSAIEQRNRQTVLLYTPHREA